MSVDTERLLAEYSIYNLKAIRRNKINPLFDKHLSFPEKNI